MALKTCKNGHRYDDSITPECPECAALARHTLPLDGFDDGMWGEPDDYGKTQPVRGPAAPARGATVPVNPAPEHWADVNDYRDADAVQDHYDPTMPVNYGDTAIQPVTGWLVCIEGTEKGRDYRLHAEMNYIGRSKANDVVLSSDNTVSRERHALIAYDDRDKLFYFAPASGSSLVRRNGKPVLSTTELNSGDRLEIGSGTYIFVPLCGEGFQW